MREKVFKLPNSLITNQSNLSPSAIGVAEIFYAFMNKHRKFTGSLKKIAQLSYRCEDTVSQDVSQLEKAGYIKIIRNWRYSQEYARNIYTATTYYVIHPVEKDYTLIPYSWLQHKLTPCTLQVTRICRMFMVKEPNRSYPSLRNIADTARIAKSTVCRAMKDIMHLGILLVKRCEKENGAFACNSYHILKKIKQATTPDLTNRHKQQPIPEHSKIQASPHFSLELSYHTT